MAMTIAQILVSIYANRPIAFRVTTMTLYSAVKRGLVLPLRSGVHIVVILLK
jgi:hypothetical protein